MQVILVNWKPQQDGIMYMGERGRAPATPNQGLIGVAMTNSMVRCNDQLGVITTIR